jgi:hypothetical protein
MPLSPDYYIIFFMPPLRSLISTLIDIFSSGLSSFAAAAVCLRREFRRRHATLWLSAMPLSHGVSYASRRRTAFSTPRRLSPFLSRQSRRQASLVTLPATAFSHSFLHCTPAVATLSPLAIPAAAISLYFITPYAFSRLISHITIDDNIDSL